MRVYSKRLFMQYQNRNKLMRSFFFNRGFFIYKAEGGGFCPTGFLPSYLKAITNLTNIEHIYC